MHIKIKDLAPVHGDDTTAHRLHQRLVKREVVRICVFELILAVAMVIKAERRDSRDIDNFIRNFN